MSITFNIHVDGMQHLQRAFGELSKAVQGKIAARVAMAGASPILKAARENAPVETGLLKKSIKARRIKVKRGLAQQVVIRPTSMKRAVSIRKSGKYKGQLRAGGKYRAGPTKLAAKVASGKAAWRNPARYAHIVERGRKPSRAKGKALRTPFGPRKSVRASTPHPFMRPAFDSQKGAALRKMREKFHKEIQIEAQRLARKQVHKIAPGRPMIPFVGAA